MFSKRPISRIIDAAINVGSSGSRTRRFGANSSSNAYRAATKGRRLGGGIGRMATKPSFYVPFGLGSFGLGTMSGFTNALQNSPEGYAFMHDMMASGRQDPLAQPIGVYNDTLYPPYRVPGTNSLAATGELALAMFATRHGR